ncbi:MAG TPA: hypothetical protein VFK05_33915 [Polyangiaceae bacterium]|nr:hypothetical protein [Polyangiaceae bacterium]
MTINPRNIRAAGLGRLLAGYGRGFVHLGPAAAGAVVIGLARFRWRSELVSLAARDQPLIARVVRVTAEFAVSFVP